MDAAIQQFQDKMDMIRRDPAMLRTYEGDEKALSDWTSGINGSKREGIQIGEKRGKLENAKNFKSMGIPIEQIAQGTGLSIEEIQRL